MTAEEIDKIADKVMEKFLLKLPEVVGNLMSQHAEFNKAKEDFFKQYPEFQGHKEVVAQTVMLEEGKSLTKSYDEILTEAVPEIRRRLATIKKLDFETVQYPDLTVPESRVEEGPNNGEL